MLVLNDRISAEEAELFEKEEDMKELMMERTEDESRGEEGLGCRCQVGGGISQALEVKSGIRENTWLASTGRAHLENKVHRRRGIQWYGKDPPKRRIASRAEPHEKASRGRLSAAFRSDGFI